MRKYPKGSRYLILNLNEEQEKKVLDALLDGRQNMELTIKGGGVINTKDTVISEMWVNGPRSAMIIISPNIEGDRTKNADV